MFDVPTVAEGLRVTVPWANLGECQTGTLPRAKLYVVPAVFRRGQELPWYVRSKISVLSVDAVGFDI